MYDAYLFDSFEVSVRQRTVRVGGDPVKIQELPFQMLLILLERPGEIVTKQELAKQLWGLETFVEVDKSLYVMVGKLRDALGDDATQPRFIKTVSGQGYRFVAQVTSLVAPVVGSLPTPPTLKVKRWLHSLSWHMALWSLLAVALAAGATTSIYRYTHQPLASDQDRVAVGAFTNSTGNPDFDSTLSSAVQLKLQESPYLSLIPNEKFRAVFKDSDSASLTNQLHGCVSLNGQLLLTGQLIPKAQGYQVVLTAWRCANGRELTTQRADAKSPSAILSALDLATDRMRRRLGEPDVSVQKFNVPLEQATTASLTALKAFTLGEEKRAEGDTAASIASYKLATDLDPQFALAHARLGTMYNNTAQYALSRQSYQKAFDLRDRASDREKLYILAHYYDYVTGETKRAIEDYELWRTLYPRDLVPTNNLALAYLAIGQPEQALKLAQRAILLDPTNGILYGTLAEAYLKLGDYANVKLLCNDPTHGKMNVMGFHQVCFRADFALSDESGMRQQLQWAKGRPQENEILDDAGWVAMYRGRISESRRLFSEARESALLNHSDESATAAQLDEANLEADIGLLSPAKKDAEKILNAPLQSASEQARAALALARAGDTPHALTLAKRAASMAPLDSIVNDAMLASARAAVQLHQHDPQAAIQSLELARPFDLCSDMELAPGYYRGLAYMQDNQPLKAVTEFQRVIDHQSLADFSVYVALSQLELGHAQQVLGDRANSTRAYLKAENVWKGADADFPPLQKLRAYRGEPSQISSTLVTQAGLR